MKKITIRFEKDSSLEDIEILVRAPEQDDDVMSLIDRIMAGGAENIVVTDGNGKIDIVQASDIVLLSVNGKQVSVITQDNKYIARQSLNSIEVLLDPSKFLRISRYEIINLAKVVRYDFTLGGTLRVELVGGMETWASRRCIPIIRKKLSGKE